MSGRGLSTGSNEADEAGARSRLARKEREFLDGVRARQAAAAPDASGQDAVSALRMLQQRKADLALRISARTAAGDGSGAMDLHQHLGRLQAQETDLFRHQGGAQLQRHARETHRLTDELAHGRRSLASLTPRQLTEFVTWNTGFTPSELLDTADGPSEVGRGLRRFRMGMANLRRDGGREVLGAVNDLFSRELHGLVGQHGYDGSVVTDAEFAPPVPHPGSARHLMLMARLSYRAPDGRRGEQYAPIMDDHGHVLAHPDLRGHAAVRSFSLEQLLHHIGALETMYKALNADPMLREKLIDGCLQGHEDTAARMRDWTRVLGHEAAGWAPRSRDLRVDELPPEPDRSSGGPATARPDGKQAPIAPLHAGRVVSGDAQTAQPHPLRYRPAGTVIRDKHGRQLKSLGGGRWRIHR